MITNVIELTNISKMFKNKSVLNDISITVTQNEIFALLGLSGSGKSTLLKILTGQVKTTSGIAKILNEDCHTIDAKTYSKLGIVSEKGGLYERLSVYDNMLLFAKLHKIEPYRIKEVLEKVKLQNELNTLTMHLSKGMWQRLLLARAILHKPSILLLDEPTNGLDPYTTKAIQELLLEMRSEGTTIFFATHNMKEASFISDNIAFIHNGKIVVSGSLQDIYKQYGNELTLEDIFIKIIGERGEYFD